MVLGLGCTADQVVVASGVPGISVPAKIDLRGERGDYLDAVVDAGGQSYRFFFPRSDTCRAVLSSSDARFRLAGVLATVQVGDDACDAVGILSLRAWRARQGRVSRRVDQATPPVGARTMAGERSLVPRQPVEYRVVYSDEDVFFARGRFLLAREIGWPVGDDTIAVFPNTPACAGVKQKVRGTMEFREAGEPVFAVIDGDTLCPVLGFAQVLPPGAVSGAADD